MISPIEFDSFLINAFGVDSFFGVPDSVLAPFSGYLVNTYDMSKNHTVGVNEGNCVALAAGRYLATGRPACVYMQNSGLGNCVNPILSLTSEDVYNIPIVYLVGWRGAPGEKDEPQHITQGNRTTPLLELLDIEYIVIDKDSCIKDMQAVSERFKSLLDDGKSVCFLIKKGSFSSFEYSPPLQKPGSNFTLNRESALECIITHFPNDTFICSTGMISREVFEVREKNNMSHSGDFLVVGSMGHASAIALGVASAATAISAGVDAAGVGGNASAADSKHPGRVWCLDGDGAALMHMGSLASIGASNVQNFVHVVFNNASHESVGKIPTIAGSIDFYAIAAACGFDKTIIVKTQDELLALLDVINSSDSSCGGKIFVEICIAVGSRSDLGRPTIPPKQCKEEFMERIAP